SGAGQKPVRPGNEQRCGQSRAVQNPLLGTANFCGQIRIASCRVKLTFAAAKTCGVVTCPRGTTWRTYSFQPFGAPGTLSAQSQEQRRRRDAVDPPSHSARWLERGPTRSSVSRATSKHPRFAAFTCCTLE